MLRMLTRKLHSTKVLLFSLVYLRMFSLGNSFETIYMTNVKSKAYTPSWSTSVDSPSSKNSLHLLSRSVLRGNCHCQMLVHYLKLHTISQYWLLSTADIHSLITELCVALLLVFFKKINSLYHKVLFHKVLEHKCPSDTTPWNNQSSSKVFLFF